MRFAVLFHPGNRFDKVKTKPKGWVRGLGLEQSGFISTLCDTADRQSDLEGTRLDCETSLNNRLAFTNPQILRWAHLCSSNCPSTVHPFSTDVSIHVPSIVHLCSICVHLLSIHFPSFFSIFRQVSITCSIHFSSIFHPLPSTFRCNSPHFPLLAWTTPGGCCPLYPHFLTLRGETQVLRSIWRAGAGDFPRIFALLLGVRFLACLGRLLGFGSAGLGL